MEPPPLPLEIRDRILAHLLPPTLPLPQELLSRTFLERLTFLPPDDSDLDAHLTPLPSRDGPHPLTDALSLLALSPPSIRQTEYAHDGEMPIAHTLLTPEHGDAVEVSFQHEAGDKGRGWVYSGAKLGNSAFDWRSDPSDVSYAGYEDAPEDYWAGFTPPSQQAELYDDHHDDEDNYWAQYGAGTDEPREDEHDHDEPVTPPNANISAPDQAATLSLLLQGLDTKPDDDITSPISSGSRKSDGSVLEQKIRAKARSQLMRAWADFSSSAADAESAGYDWLRLGREVADRPSWGAGESYAEARTAVVVARLEAAKDLHDMLGEEGFWRLVEETIRIHTNPVGDGSQEYEES
ncbi:uncharacterized protein CcaverHIS019_0207840 [Cutaneotrichosporon cavernicola]|uniref:Uncharacterized protein n=1 Tax=Cutaneotrichosporon cavernicola TaxID=279322 RepID=A0AA48L1S0_9TREE|nr:uncharacterized protein CcaverHIS019_0207840 [Cutaneotrichosporon cavernicola]BEI89422.1 hypothetical protein CcaverHIS019_0207840 [Cutaneotrichosporon cavernicola]